MPRAEPALRSPCLQGQEIIIIINNNDNNGNGKRLNKIMVTVEEPRTARGHVDPVEQADGRRLHSEASQPTCHEAFAKVVQAVS